MKILETFLLWFVGIIGAAMLAAGGLATAVFLPALAALAFALPMWLLLGWLGPVYLTFIPALYLTIGYLPLAGLIYLIGLVKKVVLPAAWKTVK